MFVGEVVRLLEEQGGLDSSEADKGAALEVPESVRAVTRQRLRGLSAECNQTLLFAAVVGREFDFGLLRRLFPDATEAEVTDALGEATRVRLVEELPRQPGRYQFSHSLIQQAIAESLSTTARAQTHADIALALEAHYGDGVDTHAVEMAYHFTESQAPYWDPGERPTMNFSQANQPTRVMPTKMLWPIFRAVSQLRECHSRAANQLSMRRRQPFFSDRASPNPPPSRHMNSH